MKSRHAGGRAWKLVAREAGGRGYVSLNLYLLSNGRALLKPCEMSENHVRRFVRLATPISLT